MTDEQEFLLADLECAIARWAHESNLPRIADVFTNHMMQEAKQLLRLDDD